MLPFADMRCCDCEHWSEDGCEEAAEALVQEGWPRADVRPEEDADASSCPAFVPARGLPEVLEEERSGREASARVAAIRGFMNG